MHHTGEKFDNKKQMKKLLREGYVIKKCKQSIRANETPKQSQERNKRNRIKTTKTRFSQKMRSETIEDAMASFKTECRKQPVYICTSCHRLL